MNFPKDSLMFKFLSTVNEGCKFRVFYDPGEDAGSEVYSFQGSVTAKRAGWLDIDYTYQEESDCFHDVCYGMMGFDLNIRTILDYTLHDKYRTCFEPSADCMLEIFDKGEPECTTWWSDSPEFKKDKSQQEREDKARQAEEEWRNKTRTRIEENKVREADIRHAKEKALQVKKEKALQVKEEKALQMKEDFFSRLAKERKDKAL